MESAVQEDIDAFANPTKQSAPPMYTEDPVDYGEMEEEEEQPYIQGDYAMQEEKRPSLDTSQLTRKRVIW